MLRRADIVADRVGGGRDIRRPIRRTVEPMPCGVAARSASDVEPRTWARRTALAVSLLVLAVAGACGSTGTTPAVVGPSPGSAPSPPAPIPGLPALPTATTVRALDVAHAACLPAAQSGLDAAVVASSGEELTGRVDATGCDIGIYVPPGSEDVVIERANIFGAFDHAVLVQDSSRVAITSSNVTVASGAPPHHGPIMEDKAITLAGTSFSLVSGNEVSGLSHGGIAVVDDGPAAPATLRGGERRAAKDDAVVGNWLSGGGCAIVLAAWVPGEGVRGNVVEGNVVKDGDPGGVVVAADMVDTSAVGNLIEGNVVEGNQHPGVVIHSNETGDVVRANMVIGNTVIGNGSSVSYAKEFGIRGGHSVGIAILGAAGWVDGSYVAGNTVRGQFYGVYALDARGTRVVGNMISVARGGSRVATAKQGFAPSWNPTAGPP